MKILSFSFVADTSVNFQSLLRNRFGLLSIILFRLTKSSAIRNCEEYVKINTKIRKYRIIIFVRFSFRYVFQKTPRQLQSEIFYTLLVYIFIQIIFIRINS